MRRIATLLACLVAIVAFGAAPALGAEPRFEMSEIEAELMCPTCQSRLDMSHSPAADRIRAFVAEKRDLGWTKDQVKEALVADFGPAVLAAPPARGIGLVAWLVPLLAVGGALAILAGAAIAWRRRRPPPPPTAAEAPDPARDAAIEERIDAELRALDDAER